MTQNTTNFKRNIMKTLMALTLSSILFSSFSVFAHDIKIPTKALSNINIADIQGQYENQLGFKTTVKINSNMETTINFGADKMELFDNGDYFIDTKTISFSAVNGSDIIFKIKEKCDDTVCTENSGNIVLHKNKSNGKYKIEIVLTAKYHDRREGLFLIEDLASKGDKTPALTYCKNSYPKKVSSNFSVINKQLGACEARVMFFMKKSNK